ncbi:hypothetical protein AKH21_02165 [Pelagibacteraceae bacterium GOM-A5]|nr:hypothetical protein AKH21_02165 [Pelagibacteraceae bacterium GOM-A5]
MKKINIKDYNTIFIDFDGTIKQSDEIKGKLFYEIFGGISLKLKKKIYNHHINNLGISRNIKIPTYIKYCQIVSNDVNKKFYTKKYTRLIFEKVCKSRWVPGVIKFFKINKEKKFVLVTASPQNEIKKILKKIKIINFFQKVYGYPNKKKIAVKNYIYYNKLNHKKCLYIGNSISDYSAAKYNKILYINIGLKKINKRNVINLKNFTYF